MVVSNTIFQKRKFVPEIDLDNVEFTTFFNELSKVSRDMGFEDVYYEIQYDFINPELVFNLKSPEDNFSSWIKKYDKILNHMNTFSKKNNCYELFRDSYIVLI